MPRRLVTQRRVVLAGALAAVVLAAGAAADVGGVFAADAPLSCAPPPGIAIPGISPDSFAQRRVACGSVTVPHGTTPETVLDGLVALLGLPDLVEAKLGGPPPGEASGLTEDPAVDGPGPDISGTLWLYVTVRAAAATPGAMSEPIWEGDVLGGDLKDALFEDGLQQLSGAPVFVQFPDGQVKSNVSGWGNIVSGQVFSGDSPTAVDARIRAKAASLGLTVQSLTVLNGMQPAPALIATAADPASVANDPGKYSTALFGQADYEATYLQINDRSGDPVVVFSGDFRTGGSARWIDPAVGDPYAGIPVPPVH